MDATRRSGPAPTDGGGGRAWHPSAGYLGLALAIVAGGVALLLSSWSAPTDVVAQARPPASSQVVASGSPLALPRLEHDAASPSSAPLRVAAATRTRAQTPAVPAAAAPQIPRMRDPDGDQTPDLSDYVNAGETPTMDEVIDRLHRAGVNSGLGAFSPPGTRPPLVGLAVPEDFPLPEGYVRHYQATDDGQRIEPILMYSPDRPVLDASGRPIAIPEDRVVPPELAPPGLPIRRIAIPAPIDPGRPGR
jgi:hypothetical protein